MPIGRIPAPSGSRRPSRAAIFMRHRVRHRPMRSCSENNDLKPPTRKVGVGIEAHFTSIPIPNVFMRHRVRHPA